MPNQVTCFHWRKEFGGPETDQVKRLKELESEASNAIRPREMPKCGRLRKAVSNLTLEKLVLTEAATGVRAVSETVQWTVLDPNGRSP